jgi:hypothetical protein
MISFMNDDYVMEFGCVLVSRGADQEREECGPELSSGSHSGQCDRHTSYIVSGSAFCPTELRPIDSAFEITEQVNGAN